MLIKKGVSEVYVQEAIPFGIAPFKNLISYLVELNQEQIFLSEKYFKVFL